MHSDDSPLPCHMAGAVSLKSGDGLAMLMGSGSSPHLKKVLGGVLHCWIDWKVAFFAVELQVPDTPRWSLPHLFLFATIKCSRRPPPPEEPL